MTDIVLTGLPRSGTTLSCYLLHQLPNCVALHEPIQPRREFRDATSPAEAASQVDRYFDRTRQAILTQARVSTQLHQGQIPQNPYGDLRPDRQSRERLLERGDLVIDKPLTPSFALIIKHPALFTGLLPQLIRSKQCFALIRNPLAVLASWASNRAERRQGRLPTGEALDPHLAQSLKNCEDVIARQLIILNWFFARFRQHLAPAHIIRYEEVVATRGRALAVVQARAADLAVPLENKNLNPLYDRFQMRQRGERLLASDNACWQFYERWEVEALLDQIR